MVVGIFAGNGFIQVLVRAVWTMLICWMIGRVIGGLAQRSVDQDIAAYRAANPIPADDLLDDEIPADTGPSATSAPVEPSAAPAQESV